MVSISADKAAAVHSCMMTWLCEGHVNKCLYSGMGHGAWLMSSRLHWCHVCALRSYPGLRHSCPWNNGAVEQQILHYLQAAHKSARGHAH